MGTVLSVYVEHLYLAYGMFTAHCIMAIRPKGHQQSLGQQATVSDVPHALIQLASAPS